MIEQQQRSLLQSAETQPATVLYLHSSDDLYGSDIILLQIVKGLDPAKYRPLVILPADMKHVGLLSRELALAGVEYYHLPIAVIRRRYLSLLGLIGFIGRILRGTWTVWRLVRTRNPKLVHGFTLAVVGAPVVALVLRVPLIMHAHEILIQPQRLRKAIHWLATHTARRVICVSDAVRANITEDEPRTTDHVIVIRNGISPAPATTTSSAELRRELGLGEGPPVVGMIGRVSPWKGQEILAQAASVVIGRGDRAQFVAIGGVFDGERHHLDRLQKVVVSLHLGESFRLVDFRKDARRFFDAFDIFVLPSTAPDPLPTVVLEAMAASLPVIATAHGGAPEMVIDGETGLLIRPGDPEALAGAIGFLLSDPDKARGFGTAGRARFISNFSLERFISDIQTLYASIL